MFDKAMINPLRKPVYRVAVLSMVVVLLWGITSWLRLLAGRIPPLELTGIALVGAALSSHLLPGTRSALKTAVRDHPWYVWPIVAGGMIGGAGFYFAALAYAPASQVVVIAYSWPLLFAIVSDVYNGRRPAPLTFVSLFIGLAGVVVMHGLGQAPSLGDWLGYAGGLAAGLCWTGFSLFLQVYSRPITPAYPAFLAAGAVTALALQAILGGLGLAGFAGCLGRLCGAGRRLLRLRFSGLGLCRGLWQSAHRARVALYGAGRRGDHPDSGRTDPAHGVPVGRLRARGDGLRDFDARGTIQIAVTPHGISITGRHGYDLSLIVADSTPLS